MKRKKTLAERVRKELKSPRKETTFVKAFIIYSISAFILTFLIGLLFMSIEDPSMTGLAAAGNDTINETNSEPNSTVDSTASAPNSTVSSNATVIVNETIPQQNETINETSEPEINETDEGVYGAMEEGAPEGNYGVMNAPTQNTPILNSTLGTNLTSENLTCWANATDADEDNINYSGYWTKNGPTL